MQRWMVMGMAEVMFGSELHPDRVIPIEKLYEILNEYGISYSFPAQHGIESNAFAVVRCKDCRYCQSDAHGLWCFNDYEHDLQPDDFCSYGERKDDG